MTPPRSFSANCKSSLRGQNHLFYTLLSNGRIRELRVINLLGIPTTLDGMSVLAAVNKPELNEATKDINAGERDPKNANVSFPILALTEAFK
jgi:hypothetical protein